MKRVQLYYDMKSVILIIDRDRNLIVQFPVFLQPYTQQLLILHQIETVPVPIIDHNKQANSYTHLQIDRPCITLNSETYILIRQQEFGTCKRIGYEFYCETLYVIKHKSKCSGKSVTYFDLSPDITKENCKFVFFYFNKTDITLTVLKRGNEIILQISQILNISSVMSIMIFQLRFLMLHIC